MAIMNFVMAFVLQQVSAPAAAPPQFRAESFRLPKNFQFEGEQFASGFGAGLAVGDFDGDGIGDMAAGAPGVQNLGVLGVFRGPRYDKPRILRPAPGRFQRGEYGLVLGAGDLDNDSFAELICANRDETVIYKGPKLNPWLRLDHGSHGFIVHDFNDDGFRDLLWFGSNFASAAILLGPTLSQEVEIPMIPDGRRCESIAVGDLNGDGIDDIVCGSRLSNAAWYSFGPGYDDLVEIADPEPKPSGEFGFSVGAGDFNADGYDDIVVTSMATPCSYGDLCRDCLVYFGPEFVDPVQITDRLESRFWGTGIWIVVSDVNHDGFDDIVTPGQVPDPLPPFRKRPEIFAYLGPSFHRERFIASDRDSRDTSSGLGGRMVAVDLEGDGRQEILISDQRANPIGDSGSRSRVHGVVHVFNFSSTDSFVSMGYGNRSSSGGELRLTGMGRGRPGTSNRLEVRGFSLGAGGVLMTGLEPTSMPLFPQGQLTGAPAYLRVVPIEFRRIYNALAAGEPFPGILSIDLLIPIDPMLTWSNIYFQVASFGDDGRGLETLVSNGLRLTIQQ